MSCPHASHSGVLVALLTTQLASISSAQDGTPAQPAPAQAAQTPATQAPHRLARWLDAQTFTVSARYDYIQDARERTLQNRMQTQVQADPRFKIDDAGRYSLHVGVATGNSFSSGWNSTGLGTGDRSAMIYLKQLFIAAEPWNGIEMQYGSLNPERGQSTEITTYDNDGYLTAARVNLRRPREVFFDEITVSVGYVGYLDTAFVFDRTGAFSRQNYWQMLASKEVLHGLTVSTDYSVIEEDGVLRQGATWRVDQRLVDTVRGEYGVRLRGESHQTAFAFSGEKDLAGVTLQVGYANVDPVFGVLNGDPYGAGDRVFTSGSFPLPLDLSASWFVQKEISRPASSSNDLRVDLAIAWDVLKTLKRAGRGQGRPTASAVGRDQPRRMATSRMPKHSTAPPSVVTVGGR